MGISVGRVDFFQKIMSSNPSVWIFSGIGQLAHFVSAGISKGQSDITENSWDLFQKVCPQPPFPIWIFTGMGNSKKKGGLRICCTWNFQGYYTIKEIAIGIFQGLYNKTVKFSGMIQKKSCEIFMGVVLGIKIYEKCNKIL